MRGAWCLPGPQWSLAGRRRRRVFGRPSLALPTGGLPTRDGERGEGGRSGGFDPTGACRRLASTVFQSADARATPRSSPHVSRPPHPSLPRRDAHLLQAEPRAVRAVSAPRSPRAPYGARRFGS